MQRKQENPNLRSDPNIGGGSPEKLGIAGGMTLYKSELAIDELYRWLVKIRPNNRTEDVDSY